jgi:F0F1-type ATP synthase delta subunit
MNGVGKINIMVYEVYNLTDEKMKRLSSKLSEQFKKSAKLEKKIKENLKAFGYEI